LYNGCVAKEIRTMSARAKVHRLVDSLPDEEMEAVERFLSELTTLDPLERVLLLAPPDDEPETEEERALVEEGLRDIREGRVRSHRDVKRSLGLE
jgi:hypothetical protein